MLKFVRTGLVRYLDARETVGFFEETIHKSVVHALQHRKWRTFRPSSNNKSSLATGKAKGDTYLEAWLEGSTKRRKSIRFVYLGIYWEDPVIAAVGLRDARWKTLPLKPPRAPKRGIIFDPSDQCLALAVGKQFKPDADFKRLLEALEDSLESDA
jgi:hypothetical protein